MECLGLDVLLRRPPRRRDTDDQGTRRVGFPVESCRIGSHTPADAQTLTLDLHVYLH